MVRYVRRRALLVGINNYENPANNLNGCVADMVDMHKTLLMFGFPPTRIKTLVNEQATTAGIINGLEWLVKELLPGDVATFFYSGHGSQVADLDNEEHDGYDEIICPYDISWNEHKYITDDNLYEYFTSKLPEGVRTDAVFDSCYSGTVTKSIDMNGGNGRKKQRYLPPPLNHRLRLNTMIPQFTKVNYLGDSLLGSGVGKELGTEKVQHNTLWGACQENQVSWELMFAETQEVRGAFTFYFCDWLRANQGNITRGDLYRGLRTNMASDGFEQIPYLEVPNEAALNLFPFRKASEIDQPSEVKTIK